MADTLPINFTGQRQKTTRLPGCAVSGMGLVSLECIVVAASLAVVAPSARVARLVGAITLILMAPVIQAAASLDVATSSSRYWNSCASGLCMGMK